MIPQETIEQIASANDIVEVIGSYFPLKRAGANFRALCPFHQEKSPSFNVNPQRQSYHCFGCGAGGTVFRFVMEYENIDFPAAVKKLADRVGITIVEKAATPEEIQKRDLKTRLLTLHREAADWFHKNLVKKPAAQIARNYLKNRGLNSQIAGDWLLGYAPDSIHEFSDWAKSKGYNDTELLQSGLVKLREEENPSKGYYDRFRNRILFPIFNDYGEVIAFSGRILEEDSKRPKYLNSPETLLFTKGKVLFGLHKTKRAIIDKKSAIVMEGQLDLITTFESGIQNVIAPQGTAFTEKQAQHLKRFTDEAILCFDADTAGLKAIERSLIPLIAVGITTRVAALPQGYDPDQLIRQKGAEAFAKLISNARDFFDFQIDHAVKSPEFQTPKGKTAFAKKMAELLGLLLDPTVREQTISKTAATLKIPVADLKKMISSPAGDTRHKNPEKQQFQKLPPNIATLCYHALYTKEARDWLLTQDWKTLLSNTQNSDLLQKILKGDIHPEEKSSVGAFFASLPPEEESLLISSMPEKDFSNVRDWWNDLMKSDLLRRRDIANNRLNLPDLSMEEIATLQKEILDLQRQLTDISRPLSSQSVSF